MIELTLLSGKPFLINPHQIETAEAKPDTTLHLLSGKTIVVKESIPEFQAKVVAYRRSIGVLSDTP
ncbi:MAG: flagellar FlbD family protein [Spirochaetota bacterium]